MSFAFCPDDGPPRVMRYVLPGTLPGRDLLALYDKSKNLLIIDRDHFDRLPPYEQRAVLRTHHSALRIVFRKNATPIAVPA